MPDFLEVRLVATGAGLGGPARPPQAATAAPPVAQFAPPQAPGAPVPPLALPAPFVPGPGAPPRPASPFDPVIEAQRAMERDRQKAQVEAERRRIDPEFRARREQEERGPGFFQRFNQPVSALTQGGGAMPLVTTALQAIPVFGTALSIATLGLKAFADSAFKTAERVGSFSPEVAIAQADASIRRIENDLRRAQTLGPKLAGFVEARSQLSEKFEDAKVKFMETVLPMITKVLEFLSDILGALSKLPEATKKVEEEIKKAAKENPAAFALNYALNGPSGIIYSIAQEAKKIARNTEKKDEGAGEDFIDDFLRAIRPAGAGPELPPPAGLNLPIFNGF